MSRCRALALACLILPFAAAAAEHAPSTPSPSADTVRDAMDYYADWVGFRQQYLRIPGVQIAVRADGREVLATSFGVADVERDVALTNAHLFRVASQSKTITSTAVFQLVERGSLRLDDTAGQWLPWLKEGGSPLAEATVRELLSHASGIIRDGHEGDFWHLDKPFPDSAALRAEVLARTAAVLPANQRFKYSNIGYGLLGLIIEAAAGEPYNAFVQRGIVDRLGLRDMGPEFDPARLDDFATGYTALSYAPARVPIDHVGSGALSPATGFFANASDLATYFSIHVLGDPRLLGDASRRRMQQPLWDSDASGGRYGLGLGIRKVGDRTLVGHSGGYPGFASMSLVDPKAGITVSVLTNAIDGQAGQLAQGAFHLLNLAGKPAAVGAPPAAQLQRFTGRYATLFSLVDIVRLGNRLYMIAPTGIDPAAAATPLVYVDAHTLRVDGGSVGTYGEPVEFSFRPDGSVASMRLGVKYLPIEDFQLPQRLRLKD